MIGVVVNKREHLQALDGFRGSAALLVVAHHAWLQSWPYNLYPNLKPTGLTAMFTGWLAFGKVAVTAFIVISGFSLMLPVVRHGKKIEAGRFFLHRCRRILPPYYAALIFAIFLDMLVIWPHSGTVYDASLPLTGGGVLSHLFLFQNFTPDIYQISGPFWSIAVECQIYLLFPFFVWTYKHYGLWILLALTTMTGFSTSYLLQRVGFENTFSHYIVMFGFGMCAAHYAFSLREDQIKHVVWSCYVLVPSLLLAAVLFHHKMGSAKLVTDSVIGGLTAICLTFTTVRPRSLLARLMSVKALAWTGVCSYSLYLIHFPLQQLLWQFVAHPAGWSRLGTFLFITLVGTPCILLVARGFFVVFEKPYVGGAKKFEQLVAANGNLA